MTSTYWCTTQETDQIPTCRLDARPVICPTSVHALRRCAERSQGRHQSQLPGCATRRLSGALCRRYPPQHDQPAPKRPRSADGHAHSDCWARGLSAKEDRFEPRSFPDARFAVTQDGLFHNPRRELRIPRYCTARYDAGVIDGLRPVIRNAGLVLDVALPDAAKRHVGNMLRWMARRLERERDPCSAAVSASPLRCSGTPLADVAELPTRMLQPSGGRS